MGNAFFSALSSGNAFFYGGSRMKKKFLFITFILTLIVSVFVACKDNNGSSSDLGNGNSKYAILNDIRIVLFHFYFSLCITSNLRPFWCSHCSTLKTVCQ